MPCWGRCVWEGWCVFVCVRCGGGGGGREWRGEGVGVGVIRAGLSAQRCSAQPFPALAAVGVLAGDNGASRLHMG